MSPQALAPPPSPHSLPFANSLFLLNMCVMCPRKSALGNCRAGWSQARLSLLGVLLLWPSGLWKARLPPRVIASLAPPHPRLGFYLLPHALVVGGLPGASLQLLPLLPPPYLCPFPRGCLSSVFSVSFVYLFSKMLRADRQGRGLSAHLAQGSEKGQPRASGDQLQYCTSWLVARGCVQ